MSREKNTQKIPKLQVLGEHPDWMQPRACRFVEEMVETLFREADIGGGISGTMRFSRDASVRKRKGHSSGEITLRPTGVPNSLCLFVVGDDAREDLCEVFVSLPQGACNALCLFIKGQPREVWRVKKEFEPELPKEVGVVIGLPPPDLDSLALYLDSIRESGGEMTLRGAHVLAVKMTGSPDIVRQVVEAGFLQEHSDIYTLTEAGIKLVAKHIGQPQTLEVTPPPHRFDILRTALSGARVAHEKIKAEHDKHGESRSELNRQLKAARSAEGGAAATIARMERELKDVRDGHEQLRKRTLELEAQFRQLPDEGELHRAEIELQRAQREYDDFTKIP